MQPDALCLEWRDLALWRGERCLQRNLNGVLQPGRALTVRGPNGCGKTTLLRTLCGLSEPQEGTVLYGSEPLFGNMAAFFGVLAYAGHSAALKDEFSARENLRFAAALAGGQAGEEDLLAPLGLTEFADLPCRSLSAGQRRRVSLARVLQSGRRFWVLDEPFNNLDDAGRDWLGERLLAHVAGNGAVLLTAHQPTPWLAAIENVLLLTGARA